MGNLTYKEAPTPGKCWITGCDLDEACRGLCSKHYSYQKKYGNKEFPRDSIKHILTQLDEVACTATCSICGPNTKISRHRRKGRPESSWWGCGTKRIRAQGTRKKLQAKLYGLTVEEFDVLIITQRGLCAICSKQLKDRVLHIDHDHRTNKVRGLLCNKCNGGLGHFEDNVDFLTLAIEYLRQYSE